MSFIESLLMRTINVDCQTDYCEISSNQCSWCAALFAKNYKKLKSLVGNESKFKDFYTELLIRASKLRAEYGTILYGENIDNRLLLKETGIKPVAFYTKITNSDDKFLIMLPDDLRDEFYKHIYMPLADLDCVATAPVMISRHGQSFTIIPLDPSLVLVLDSHCRQVGIMIKDNMKKYIFNSDGHTHTTLIVCDL